jgi:predicted amidohydrolase/GNAT superfamily N-acetyltransferase
MSIDKIFPDYKIQLRQLKIEDYDDLMSSMKKAYSSMDGSVWKKEKVALLLQKFPEGQICIEVNGKAVACALSLIVKYGKFGDKHTYEQITGNYTFNTHDNKGDVLYGIDVFVDPEYQGLRLGRRLYDARKQLCENLNLRSIVAGGRIPGYMDFHEQMTPGEYITKVKQKEIFDPILTFQISNDFHVRKILDNYLPYDHESKSYATLIEWINVYYEEKPQLIGRSSVVRIGVVQWQMRNTATVDAMFDQIEFFVDAVSGYKSDFILFPELFNAPLMEKYNHLSESDAIRELATYTEEFRSRFLRLAVSYNINIICGSMPFYKDEKLYNISYLCRRDGSWDFQYKLHITPNEASYWGMIGGDELKVFDTDRGKIGILICYDSEFPELSRLMADKGMEILFVPFLTDTQTGFNRVRICSQARAIENECYVAIAGCIGNLPRVKNMDIQYAQSAVFSPSDFMFPNNAIVAEATPNNEMTLIADVDLSLLKELHEQGSVHTLKDRRLDLYNLSLKKEIIETQKI